MQNNYVTVQADKKMDHCFMMTPDDAINFSFFAFSHGNGEILVKKSPATTIETYIRCFI